MPSVNPSELPGWRWQASMVEIETADKRRLELFWHEPEGVATATVVLLHGKGANAYSGVAGFLAPRLAASGLRAVSLNMRSHDLGYTRTDVPFVDLEDGRALVDGGMWEDLNEGSLDVEAVLDALGRAGVDGPVALCGHSSGGYYAALCGDGRINGRVLLSPLVANGRPLRHWFGEEFEEICAYAARLVAAGDGDRLIPTPRWYYAISARSLVQRVSEAEGIFGDSLRAHARPALFLWGEREGRGRAWRALAADIGANFLVVPGVEHHYLGAEGSVADAVAAFTKTFT